MKRLAILQCGKYNDSSTAQRMQWFNDSNAGGGSVRLEIAVADCGEETQLRPIRVVAAFEDAFDAIAAAGASAVAQPGGSVRDEEVIGAANEHGIAMVFTGRRHFRH